ncbi:MAG: hypothetical protein IID46_15230, partial [Planctomycetes bacterium]|nr:hypothetical protein [Planctomycetota bacterium]
MQEEIAESFQKMRQSPTSVIYSDLPADEIEDRSNEQLEDDMSTDAKGPVFADDEDFVPDDEDFEIAEGVIVTRSSAKTESESDANQLAQTSEASSDDADTKQASSTADAAADSEKMQPDAEKQTDDNQSEQTQQAHSVATGGDALLKVALEEEAESQQSPSSGRRSGTAKPRYPDGILIYCPNGHRIEVKEKFRGRTGQCPKCKTPFIVPVAEKSEEPESETQDAEQAGNTKFSHWMTDVRIHAVSPEKLKLKANSLKGDFQLFDLTFDEQELLGLALS